jgi:hypothetical protein
LYWVSGRVFLMQWHTPIACACWIMEGLLHVYWLCTVCEKPLFILPEPRIFTVQSFCSEMVFLFRDFSAFYWHQIFFISIN